MSEHYNKFLAIYILIVALTIAYFLYYRLSNPKITETQLFLSKWYIGIPVIVLGILLVVLKEINQTKNK